MRTRPLKKSQVEKALLAIWEEHMLQKVASRFVR